MRIVGRCSLFGGPDDMGVAPDEGLAFIYDTSQAPDLFLDQQPAGTTGLARRLNPEKFYIACRWDYDAPYESKAALLNYFAEVRFPVTGKRFYAQPADWGPGESTGRVCDLSPGLANALGVVTDDVVEVIYPIEPITPVVKVAFNVPEGVDLAISINGENLIIE
jgi:hypothetical protein